MNVFYFSFCFVLLCCLFRLTITEQQKINPKSKEIESNMRINTKLQLKRLSSNRTQPNFIYEYEVIWEKI